MRITIDIEALRMGPGQYRARIASSPGFMGPEGLGRTAKAAKDDLRASLVWASHVEPRVVYDAIGEAWLLYPGRGPEWWTARRLSVATADTIAIQRSAAPVGGVHLSDGSTHFCASDHNAAIGTVQRWNECHALIREERTADE